MAVLLSLFGGPLDGIFLPLTARANSSPGQIFVYYPELSTWTVYRDPDTSEAVVDVYRLRRGGDPMVSKPKDVETVPMVYVRTLTPAEVQIIEKLGPKLPPGFK